MFANNASIALSRTRVLLNILEKTVHFHIFVPGGREPKKLVSNTADRYIYISQIRRFKMDQYLSAITPFTPSLCVQRCRSVQKIPVPNTGQSAHRQVTNQAFISRQYILSYNFLYIPLIYIQ